MAMPETDTFSGVRTDDSGFSSLPVKPIRTETQKRWAEVSRLDLAVQSISTGLHKMPEGALQVIWSDSWVRPEELEKLAPLLRYTQKLRGHFR